MQRATGAVLRSGTLRRLGLAIAIALGAAGTVTACAGASSNTGGNAHSTSAKSEIERNWVSFFSGSTSAQKKLDVLQDASEFRTIVDGQASSPLAKGASAKVASVTVHGSTATVRYTVYLDGAPALKNETGEAVKSGGTWKVTVASFCTLLDLEQVKTKACSSGTSS